MSRRYGIVGVFLFLVLACTIPVPTTEPLTIIEPVQEEQTVARGEAQQAEVHLRLLGDSLNVHPADSGDLLTASFHYNVKEWKPELKQNVQDQTAHVTISQGIGTQISLGKSDQYINEWDVGLSPGIPVDLSVEIGYGKTQMDLGGLSLSKLSVLSGNAELALSFSAANPVPLSMLRLTSGNGKCVVSGLGNANFDRLSIIGGAGGMDLNFDGDWRRAALADIKAGAGRITIRVPATLGVRVQFSGTAVSPVETTGFSEPQEHVYVNGAYGQAPLTLTINLTAGVGTVTLISQ